MSFLRCIGLIDFMISDNLNDSRYEDNYTNRNPGLQKIYSDQAIIKVLKIRYLFGLKWWQIQGFLDYIFGIIGLENIVKRLMLN